MFELFLITKQFDLAKLAAFWSLRNILKVERRISDVAMSFRSVLIITALNGESNRFKWLEGEALKHLTASLFNSNMNVNGLIAAAKMYHALMLSL